METAWLKEVLFIGASANAFKLGTTLTLGWFWPRVSGCLILYRGSNMEAIDFTNVLAVAEADACEISPPSYLQHNSDSTYFYVVRRANSWGQLEHTLIAAAKVSINAAGKLSHPQPNSIFEMRAEQIADNKIELVWHYCPLQQKSEPAYFKVYYDDGTGQVNYDSPIMTINYGGRGFCRYQSDTLDSDRYLFAIRVVDAVGTVSDSLASSMVQLNTGSPPQMDVLSIKAI